MNMIFLYYNIWKKNLFFIEMHLLLWTVWSLFCCNSFWLEWTKNFCSKGTSQKQTKKTIYFCSGKRKIKCVKKEKKYNVPLCPGNKKNQIFEERKKLQRTLCLGNKKIKSLKKRKKLQLTLCPGNKSIILPKLKIS